MKFDEYIPKAVATESKVALVQFDLHQLGFLLQLNIAAGTLLDQAKKQIFYGKEPNVNEKNAAILSALTGLTHIQAGIGVGAQVLPVNTRLLHAFIGMATESTELLEILQSMLKGEPYDRVHVGEEIGDVMWYTAVALDEAKLTMGDVLDVNIEKLTLRNKGAEFNAEATVNRDVTAERDVLESLFSPADAAMTNATTAWNASTAATAADIEASTGGPGSGASSWGIKKADA